MSEMLQVIIDSVRVSLMSPQRLVVLRQVDSERYLPIWVGPYEAEAITVALQEIEMARPLTHDLLKNVIAKFNARIIRVEIIALRDDIFYGNIIAESEDGRILNIDSRPSDAIALAVRAHVPIMVHPSVMDLAGIVPEEDMTAQASQPVQPSSPAQPSTVKPTSPDDSRDDRLSIFEDFLSGLDLDKKPPEKPNEDEDPDKPKKT